MATPASIATMVTASANHHHHHHHHHHHRPSRRLHAISTHARLFGHHYNNYYTHACWMPQLLHHLSTTSTSTSNRWTRMCNSSMLTTDIVDDKGVLGVSSSIQSTFKATKEEDDDEDDNPDLFLHPAPKPVLNLRPNIAPPKPTFTSRQGGGGGGGGGTLVDDHTDQVIDSLQEVLEKAEKLETSTPTPTPTSKNLGTSKLLKSNAGGDRMKPITRTNNSNNNNNGKSSSFVNATSSSVHKSNTLKSVWRKGNPVANVQKVVVKELPKVEKAKPEHKSPSPTMPMPMPGAKQLGGPSPSASLTPPLRPQMPLPSKPTPRLHAKPAVAPPPPSQSASKKPSGVVKDRKPILIDKFAGKKAVVDPIAAAAAAAEAAVLAPTKPVKRLLPSKAREERRKKSGTSGGLRKRLVDDAAISDASELDMPIPGLRKGRKWSKASRKASRRAARLQAARDAEPVKVDILEVGEEGMSTQELAYNLAVSEEEILGFLFSKGVRPDAVHTLDKDMVKMICNEHGVEVLELEPFKMEEMAKKKELLDEDDLNMLEDRPPVITIMGHVDHGKTTLLDYIRKSKVAASEAGGITQGIGAYQVLVPVDGKPQQCVFLDTPGHEAFGAMRARGARVTDITIIVVAADDGVRPQTNEAIAHAKAAGVPIIIAINKIDKDGASPDRVMQELSSIGLMPEEWGGDIPMVQISALKGENVDELLETVMLVAELQELKANPHRNAKGTVIEAGLDKSRGPVATLIVQNGTLKRGDIVVCGEAFGKMRALFDDKGIRIDKAGPSMAVQVIGLSDVPSAGDEFEVVDSLDVAREKAETCAASLRDARISAKAGEGKVTLSSIASAVSAGRQSGLDMHQLNIIFKVDVQGSIEAIRHALQVLPQDNVTLKVLLQAPGDVSTSDVDLAVAAEAIIFGFNVKAPSSVKNYADKKNVEIRLYRVIYELIDDMRNAMEGLLEPVEEQISIGVAEVRDTFPSGSGRVAGCMVTQGKMVKECGIRVVRNGKTIHTGKINSLRRVKEEVKEVGAGLECGVGMDEFNDWEDGDIIEAFNAVQKQRTLEEASASVSDALAKAGVRL